MAEKTEVLRLRDLAWQARVNLCKLCGSYGGNIHMRVFYEFLFR